MDDKKDIVDRLMLKPPLHTLTSYELVEAANEITRLRKERDEARCQVCYAEVNGQYGRQYTPQDIAKKMGWDCFSKENT
jgi:hypothetical protein